MKNNIKNYLLLCVILPVCTTLLTARPPRRYPAEKTFPVVPTHQLPAATASLPNGHIPTSVTQSSPATNSDIDTMIEAATSLEEHPNLQHRVSTSSSLEEGTSLTQHPSLLHLRGVREVPLPTPPSTLSATPSPVTQPTHNLQTTEPSLNLTQNQSDAAPILLKVTVDQNVTQQSFNQESRHNSHTTTPDPEITSQTSTPNPERDDEWEDVVIIGTGPKDTKTEDLDWFHTMQKWYQETIQDTFVVEQFATQIKAVTRYSVVLTMINQGKFKQFVEFFDTKSSGGGLRWLDKAINQAIDAKNEDATRTILNKAKEEKYLDQMAPTTKQRAQHFLQSLFENKATILVNQLTAAGLDIQDLAKTMRSTQHVGPTDTAPLSDSSIHHEAETLLQRFAQFTSSKTLVMHPQHKE